VGSYPATHCNTDDDADTTSCSEDKKVVEVFLNNLATNEMEKIGETDTYNEAITIARNSGKVPKGWNIAITETNQERIIVCCKKGPIVAGDGIVPAVTSPKKKTTIIRQFFQRNWWARTRMRLLPPEPQFQMSQGY
jgi:hypothetical protein